MDGVVIGVLGGAICALVIAFKAVKKQKVVNDTVNDKVVNNAEILISSLMEDKEKNEQFKKDLLEILKRMERSLEKK